MELCSETDFVIMVLKFRIKLLGLVQLFCKMLVFQPYTDLDESDRKVAWGEYSERHHIYYYYYDYYFVVIATGLFLRVMLQV